MFGQQVIDRLEELKTLDPGYLPTNLDDIIDWLKDNLTEAAIHGCHHCDDTAEPGAPCYWCGLKAIQPDDKIACSRDNL